MRQVIILQFACSNNASICVRPASGPSYMPMDAGVAGYSPRTQASALRQWLSASPPREDQNHKGTDRGQACDFAILRSFIGIWSRKGESQSRKPDPDLNLTRP